MYLKAAHMKYPSPDESRQAHTRSKNFISIKDNQMISIKETTLVDKVPRNVFGVGMNSRSPPGELSVMNHSTSMHDSGSLPRHSYN